MSTPPPSHPHANRYYNYLKPILKNKEVQTYSSLGFSLVMTVVFIVFAIRPTWETIKTTQGQINQQKEVLKQLKAKTAALNTAKAELAAIDPPVKEALEGMFPDVSDVTGIARTINALAEANQVNIQGIQFQPAQLIGSPSAEKKPKLEDITFTFSSDSSYTQIKAFLDTLNLSDRAMHINDTTITRDPENNTLLVVVNAKAYITR